MRRQALLLTRERKRLRKQSQKRNEAVRLLQRGNTVREATLITAVSRTTVSRLKRCLDTENTTEIDHLCSKSTQSCSKPVVNDEEAIIINDQLVLAAERGFAFDANTFKHALSCVASGGLEG